MRPYEVMIIFDVGAEPPAIQAVVDRVLETVRNTGGTPGAVDRWGRRPFAYEVKHRREGYYVLVELSGEVRTVNELDRLLSLADEVLRHKVIRLPDKALKRAGPGAGAGGRPAAARGGRAGAASSGSTGSTGGEATGETGDGAATGQEPEGGPADEAEVAPSAGATR